LFFCLQDELALAVQNLSKGNEKLNDDATQDEGVEHQMIAV
jgi:hypothetical protein